MSAASTASTERGELYCATWHTTQEESNGRCYSSEHRLRAVLGRVPSGCAESYNRRPPGHGKNRDKTPCLMYKAEYWNQRTNIRKQKGGDLWT